MERLSRISLERFLMLLLFIVIIASSKIYLNTRTIRTAYVLGDLQQQYQYWADEKSEREAELASFHHPVFLLQQLDRYRLQMVVNKRRAPDATDLQLAHAGSTY